MTPSIIRAGHRKDRRAKEKCRGGPLEPPWRAPDNRSDRRKSHYSDRVWRGARRCGVRPMAQDEREDRSGRERRRADHSRRLHPRAVDVVKDKPDIADIGQARRS